MSNCNKQCGVMRSPAGKPHVLRRVEGTPSGLCPGEGLVALVQHRLEAALRASLHSEVRVFGFQLLREVKSRTAHPP